MNSFVLPLKQIIIAISYPAPNLGRDKVIPELFKFVMTEFVFCTHSILIEK